MNRFSLFLLGLLVVLATARRKQYPIPRHPPYKALIGSISPRDSAEDVMDFFRAYQIDIKSFEFKHGYKGRRLNFGYADFGDRMALVYALDEDKNRHAGRPYTVEVAFTGNNDEVAGSRYDDRHRGISRERERRPPSDHSFFHSSDDNYVNGNGHNSDDFSHGY